MYEFQFARRPIIRGQRLNFTLVKDHWYSRGLVFKSVNGVELCADTARKVLGLGKNTKKFSLWVRKAK